MAGELTRVGQRRAADAGIGKSVSAISPTYLGLATADPGDNPTLAGISEVTTAGYARQAITFAASTDADPSVSVSTNAQTFGPFSADPPSVSHCFLTDAASGTSGVILAKWTLDTARDAGNGDSIEFATGAVTMSND